MITENVDFINNYKPGRSKDIKIPNVCALKIVFF